MRTANRPSDSFVPRRRGATAAKLRAEVARLRAENERLKSKAVVAEWWEVWWIKGGQRVLVPAYGAPENQRIPPHAYPTEAGARAFVAKERNRYHRIVRVYRRAKEGGQG